LCPAFVLSFADDELSERNRQNELHVRTALARVDHGT